MYRMSHYEQLGVSETATAEDIKRAYRVRARETHPDKGGDRTEFVKVARAYEVLSDTERRLLYDATGKDARPPIEIEVQNILLGLFNLALAQDADIKLTAFVSEQLKAADARIESESVKLKARQRKLQGKRNKVKSSGTTNIVHMIIDGELKGIENGLLQLSHQAEVQKQCKKALRAYSEEWKEPETQYITLSNIGYTFRT